MLQQSQLLFRWFMSLAAFSLLISTNLHAQNTPVSPEQLMALSERVQNPPVLRADFVQTKSVQGMTRTLPSSGRFIFSRADGLYWLTVQPFESTLIMTPTQFVEIDDFGERNVMSVEDNPGMALFMQTFLAIASGDLNRLTDSFVVTGDTSRTPWNLTLVPKQPELAKLLSSATLSGDTMLRNVAVYETSGDSTQIEYQNIQLQPTELTAAERLLFNP